MIRASYRVPWIDPEKCRGCRQCLARKSCRLKALIQFEPHELPYIDQALCRGCLLCIEECPFKAVTVE